MLRLALCLPLFVAVLALAPPVCTRGEAREGLVVQSLLAGGDWIVPRREGRLASKPPLYHWIAAGFGRVLGASDTTLRLPSALGAWAMSVATWATGLAIFDRRRAWLAVGALVSTLGFWRPATEARVDMLFAAAIATALAGFAWWLRTRSLRARWALWLGCAAAVLTKGPAGAVLVGGVVVATLVTARDWRAFVELVAPAPALAALAIMLGWYALAYRRAGDEFVAIQIVHENVARAVGFGAFERQRHAHPLKMLEAFATLVLPWNVALLEGWRLAGRPARLLHAWWIVVLAFFTVAAGKRGVYLLPLYPAIALVAADWLVRRTASRRWLLAVVPLLAVATAAGAIVSARREAASSGLDAFAGTVARDVPSHATVGVQGQVSENDRLVLAYRLRRTVPRVARHATPPPLVVVPRDAASRLAAGCTARVAWPRPHGGLVLLACAGGSIAEERVDDAVDR